MIRRLRAAATAVVVWLSRNADASWADGGVSDR